MLDISFILILFLGGEWARGSYLWDGSVWTTCHEQCLSDLSQYPSMCPTKFIEQLLKGLGFRIFCFVVVIDIPGLQRRQRRRKRGKDKWKPKWRDSHSQLNQHYLHIFKRKWTTANCLKLFVCEDSFIMWFSRSPDIWFWCMKCENKESLFKSQSYF